MVVLEACICLEVTCFDAIIVNNKHGIFHRWSPQRGWDIVSAALAQISRDNLLASVKSWILFFLKPVSFNSLWMMWNTPSTSGFLFPVLSNELFGEFQADLLGLTPALQHDKAMNKHFHLCWPSTSTRCHIYFWWCCLSSLPQQFVSAWQCPQLFWKFRNECLSTLFFLLSQYFK